MGFFARKLTDDQLAVKLKAVEKKVTDQAYAESKRLIHLVAVEQGDLAVDNDQLKLLKRKARESAATNQKVIEFIEQMESLDIGLSSTFSDVVKMADVLKLKILSDNEAQKIQARLVSSLNFIDDTKSKLGALLDKKDVDAKELLLLERKIEENASDLKKAVRRLRTHARKSMKRFTRVENELQNALADVSKQVGNMAVAKKGDYVSDKVAIAGRKNSGTGGLFGFRS